MRPSGYSLIELSISVALLSIVSLLGFMAIASSTGSAALAQAKGDVQGNLRDVMAELTSIVRQAYTQRTVDSVPPMAPPNTASIMLGTSGQVSVIFQVPEPSNAPGMVNSSAPITILYENEDKPDSTGKPNGLLDAGEDTNSDGMLTRRLVLTQGDVTRVIGGANDIGQVQFQLLPSIAAGNNQLTTLRIFLESTKRFGQGTGTLMRAQIESTVHLEN